jgi:hypothetical protein
MEGRGIPHSGSRVSNAGDAYEASGIGVTTLVEEAEPGCAWKNSLASRVNMSTSGNEPVGAMLVSFTGGPAVNLSFGSTPRTALLGSLVLMVFSDFYILEHTERVFHKNCRGAIERHQVRGNRVAVNTHEANGKAGGLFAR